MLERDGYPHGVPCWVDTGQPDPEAAARFYGDLFGWEFSDIMPPGSPGRYFVARLHGRDVAAVGSQPDGAPPLPVWNTYVWVDSADAAAVRVKDAGGSVLVAPFDVLDGGRMGVFADPSGAVFCVWQAKAHRGAQIVDQAGTWVFSDLNTRDVEGSKAFYGAVFGWEADAVDVGSGETWMWRVPGYGETLAANDPDLYHRQEDFGAPEGFEDAIGWMAVASEDAPPHWSVTFAVDDTDAIATRAAKLGGTVLVPPFDAGVVRAAVLQDPQGATFTVSKFDPSMASAE